MWYGLTPLMLLRCLDDEPLVEQRPRRVHHHRSLFGVPTLNSPPAQEVAPSCSVLANEFALNTVDQQYLKRPVKHTSSHQSLLWDNRHNGLGESRREAE